MQQKPSTDFSPTEATAHLRRVDPVMRRLIRKYDPWAMPRRRPRFKSLVQVIIGQQLSGKVADTIYGRVRALCRGGRLTAQSLSRVSDTDLRQAGMSQAKIRSLRDLIQKVEDKSLNLSRLCRLSDDEVMTALLQVTGIGPWSAQMFLMFVLHRPDVFAGSDLGIRTALQRLYPQGNRKPDFEALSKRWRPYRTIACHYLWRSLENRGN